MLTEKVSEVSTKIGWIEIPKSEHVLHISVIFSETTEPISTILIPINSPRHGKSYKIF